MNEAYAESGENGGTTTTKVGLQDLIKSLLLLLNLLGGHVWRLLYESNIKIENTPQVKKNYGLLLTRIASRK